MTCETRGNPIITRQGITSYILFLVTSHHSIWGWALCKEHILLLWVLCHTVLRRYIVGSTFVWKTFLWFLIVWDCSGVVGLSLLRRNVDRKALWKAAGAGRQPVNKTSFTFKFKHVTARIGELERKIQNFSWQSVCCIFLFLLAYSLYNKFLCCQQGPSTHTFSLINGSDWNCCLIRSTKSVPAASSNTERGSY